MTYDQHRRILSRISGGILLAVAGLSAGCEFGREFRAAALPELQSGVSSILNGFVNGVFAAIEPEPETDPESTDSTE